ncbi:filamentous hemagglutinin N-terminal domain-containing protein [Sphingomonas sp.]|uniref:filamentous hemagglutinin N-terminal domain-containing protein n=1 Tax=Sphingomonas sp. TaxID=28214 RepID=UPI003CC5808B
MTRTAAIRPNRRSAGRTPGLSVRRRLALSSALGVSLGVLAAPAAAQTSNYGSFGSINDFNADVTTNTTTQVLGVNVTPDAPTIVRTAPSGGPTPTPETLNVNLFARNTVINWAQFNVPANTVANYNNGDGNAVASRAVLNQVAGGTTTLGGTVNAASNIQVWVVNGNGIMIGANANINTGALVLSSLGLDAANVETFRTTAIGGAYALRYVTTAADPNNPALANGITGGGAAAQINTTSGVLALIAPSINVTAQFRPGASDAGNDANGSVSFVIANDVSVSTTPGGPLSITINSGTPVAGNAISGAIVADKVYALINPQAAVDALLDMSGATVTNAGLTPAGVVVLGTAQSFSATGVALDPGANTTGSTSFTIGPVNLRTPVGATTPGAVGSLQVSGRSGATGGGNITAGAVTVGDALTLTTNLGTTPAAGAVAVTGAIDAGSLSLAGFNVSLGNGAAVVADTVLTDIGLNAAGGVVSIGGGVTLTGDTAGQASRVFQVGGDGTAGLALTGSTLIANPAATAGIQFATAADGSGFQLGNVQAAIVSGKIGAAAATPGAISRTGAITTGNLALSGANAISTSLTLGTGAVATGGNLTLRGDAGATIGGTLSNLAAGTGAITVTAATGAAAVSLQDSTLTGGLIVQAGTGGATFTSLAGSGGKNLTSGGGITGTAIDGGSVALRGSAGSAIAVASGIGVTTAVTSLGIDDGSTATIGTGLTGTHLRVAGTFTAGALVAPGGLTINGDALFSAASLTVGGPVAFNGSVNSTGTAGALTVAAGANTVTLAGPVGTTAAFDSFASNGAGNVALNGGALRTVNGQTYTGPLVLGTDTILTGTTALFTGGVTGNTHDLTLNLSAATTLDGATIGGVRNLATDAGGGTTLNGVVATSGTQAYGDNVTLGGAVAVNSSGTGANGNISFAGTVNGAQTLMSTTAGSITFNGAVGGGTALTSVDTGGAAGGSALNADVTTTGLQRYSAVTTGGAGPAVTLTSTGGGAITLAGTATGAVALTVNTGGVTSFNGAVTGLPALTTDAGGGTTLNTGVVTTSGAQTFGDTLTLTTATVLSGTVATFTTGVAGAGNSLTLNTSGAQQLGATVTGVGALTTDAAGTLQLTGNLTTTGAQTYNDPVTLGATVTLDAGASLIRFANTVASTNEAQGLITNSPTEFDGNAGGAAGGGVRLLSLQTGGATTIGGGMPVTIRTVNDQSYGALTLNQSATLIGRGLTQTTVDGTGAHRNLTLTFTAATSLPAGAVANVGDFLVNGAGPLSLNGGTVATTGTQTYLTPVRLLATTQLLSTGAGTAGDIAFGDTLDGPGALIVATPGTLTLSGAAGGTTPLDRIDATGAAVTQIKTTAVTTNLGQSYGATTLNGAGDVTLTSVGGGLVALGTLSGPRGLTVNTAGTTQITGTGAAAPNFITTDAGGTTRLSNAITTTGSQTYGDAVVLDANTVLTGVNGSFAGAIGGNGFDLTLNFSGLTVLNAGSFTGVRNFASGGGGTTSLTGTINVTGSQTYTDDVVLTGNTVVQSNGGAGAGAISFAKVDATTAGGQSLRISTTGPTILGGAVGGGTPPGGAAIVGTPLASLTVDNAVAINGGVVTTAGAQSYDDMTLGADTKLRTTAAAVTVTGNVNGTRTLSVQTGATTPYAGSFTVSGRIGNTAPLTALALRTGNFATGGPNAIGTIAADVGVAIAQTLTQALTVGTVDGLSGITTPGSASLTVNGGALTLNQAVTGAGVALTGNGITQAAAAPVNGGAGVLLLNGGGGAVTLNGTLTTTNGSAAAVQLLNAGSVQLGTVNTGAGATLVLGTTANPITGAVTQTAGSVVTANMLAGATGGAVTLGNANNIATLGVLTAGGLTLHTATGLTVTGPVTTGAGALTLQADGGGIVLQGAVTGGAVSLVGNGALAQTGGVLTAATLTGSATGGVTLAQTNQIASLGAFTLTGGGANFQLVDGQALSVTQNLTVPGALTLTAPGITFTGATLTATGGAATLTAGSGALTGGTILAGTTVAGSGSAVTLTAATAGGALALTANAGGLSLGTGNAASVALTSTGDQTLGAITSTGALGVGAGGAIIATSLSGSAISVIGGAAAVGTANSGSTLLIRGTAGAVSLGTGSAPGTATLDAQGTNSALTIGTSLTSGGNATTTATGATTIAAITSMGAAISVTGGSVNVTGMAKAQTTLDVTSTAGALAIGTGVTTTGALTLKSAGTLAATTLTAGGSSAATVTAAGAATLGQTTAGAGVTVTAAGITAGQTIAGQSVANAALTLTSTGNIALSGNSSASGNATFDAGGSAALGQVIAGTGATISIRALDAAITGTQRAATVVFTDRSPATTTLRLGNGTAANGFQLSQAEVNFVDANQLTFDAGTGAIELGTLAFNAAAGRTRVDMLATGRIDVTGGVSGSGSGRTFRLGGTLATTTDKASVIRVVATPDAGGVASTTNTGGRLLFDTADLDLRGGRIGVGQAAGFLDPIGFAGGATPLSASAVASNYVGNPNSSLYNSTFGGAAYLTDSVLVSARSLTVRYTDYALFQNAGVPGANTGAALGSAASPAVPALVVQGPGTGTTSAFAIFGSINGITGTGAAVTGSSFVQVSGVDLANTRINGCLAGSGAGCLTAVVSQPLLNVFDASRLNVFHTADDLALPFDPVVGTNNEALFSGFGLIDGPVTDTQCPNDTTQPNCVQNREQHQ